MQKIPSTQQKIDKINNQNYAENYSDATAFSFDFGSREASKRDVKTKISSAFNIPFFNISPEIIFLTDKKYSNTNSAKSANNHNFDFIIPFNVKKTRFTLKYSKNGQKTKSTTAGGNYKTDFEELFDSIKESDWYFCTAPFQDFFDKNFSDSIFREVAKNNAENLYYSGKYSLNWKRPLFADAKDFFVPSSFDFSSEHRINASSDFSGFYILKASILNTPMNIFGFQSKNRIFKWYKTDEYAISLSGTVKIPENSPEKTLWNLNFYIQAGYYINETDVLRTGFETEISPDSVWKITGSAQYKRNVQKNLLSEIIKFIDKKNQSKPQKQKLSRIDSLDFSLNYDDENEFVNQTYDFSHKISAALSKTFSFDCGFGLSLNVKEEITAITVSGSAGGKISF